MQRYQVTFSLLKALCKFECDIMLAEFLHIPLKNLVSKAHTISNTHIF